MLFHRLFDQHIDFGFQLILDNNVCIDVIIQNYELICDLSIFVFSRLRTRTTAMVDSTFGKLIIRLRKLCSMQIRKELLVWEMIHQYYLNKMHSQERIPQFIDVAKSENIPSIHYYIYRFAAYLMDVIG